MTREPKAMVVAGVMSGTSADGVDVAVVHISPGRDGGLPRVKVLCHEGFPYAPGVRAAVLRAMSGEGMGVPEIARLNWRLGQVYTECVAAAASTCGRKLQLVGLHGQTIYHQASAEPYLGEPVRATWQLGEAAALAETIRVPVVSDFRPADLAAGGQGAPLVPMLDFCMFRSARSNRVLLNLGGIANVTLIPAGAGLDGLLAFDTGPANMTIDALMHTLYGRDLDCGGQTGARGKVLQAAVEATIAEEPYFAAPPPKSCGREQFGAAFAERLRARCVDAGAKKPDIIATATEVTVRSIMEGYRRFGWSHLGQRAPLARATEWIVAGGGARNAFLIRRLQEECAQLAMPVRLADELGIKAEAKEAAAFALLAWLTWHGRPGNVVGATGASRPVILGKVSLA